MDAKVYQQESEERVSKHSNGSKLLSIIDRLSEKNVSEDLSGLNCNVTNGNPTALSLDTSKDVLGSHTNCEPVTSRRKRKGCVSKIERYDPMEQSNIYMMENGVNSKRLSQGSGKYEDQLSFSQEAPETRKALGTWEIPGPSSTSRKIKLTLKHGTSNNKRSALCLCKPQADADLSKRDSDITHKNVSAVEDSNSSLNQKYNCQNDTKIFAKSEKDSNFYCCSSKNTYRKGSCNYLCICGICLQQFSSTLSLEEHRRQSGHYLCSDCGEAFSNAGLLEEHVKGKKCRVGCSLCGKRFSCDEDLCAHEMKEHFKCPICRKRFRNAEKLSVHHDSNHGDQNPYHCVECDKTFLSPSRYRTHVMASHTGERPFICRECGKGFSRMYALSTHMKYTHSDEKKYRCEFCPKTFKRKDHLKNHEVIHSSKKPHCCDNCGKGFNQRVSLKRHLPCKMPKSTKTKEIGNERKHNDQTTARIRNPESKISDGISLIQSKSGNFSREFSESKESSKTFTSAGFEINKKWKSLTKNNSEIRGSSNELTDKPAEDRENSEKLTTVEPTGRNRESRALEYLGCRCPTNCACKKFTIAVDLECKSSQGVRNNFREVTSVSCCCDVEPENAMADTTSGI